MRTPIHATVGETHCERCYTELLCLNIGTNSACLGRMTTPLDARDRSASSWLVKCAVLLTVVSVALSGTDAKSVSVDVEKTEFEIETDLQNKVVYKLKGIKGTVEKGTTKDCSIVKASFTLPPNTFALVEFTTTQQTYARPLLSKSSDNICLGLPELEPPELELSSFDVQSHLSRSAYHYLVYEADTSESSQKVTVYNLNDPDEAEEAEFDGELVVTFSSSKPCPRGEAEGECSGRGTCSDGVCSCVRNEDTFYSGRSCETPAEDVTEIVAENVEGFERPNEFIHGLQHKHFVFRANRVERPYKINAYVRTGNNVSIAIRPDIIPCLDLEGRDGTINYNMDKQCFFDNWAVLEVISKELDEQNGIVYITLYNRSPERARVAVGIFICDGKSRRACPTSSRILPILIPIICSAILAPIIVLTIYRIRFGPLTRQLPEGKLSKRQIEKMFPAIAYRTRNDNESRASNPIESEEEEEEEEQCTVCLCEYEEADMVRRLPCGHMYHAKCLDSWITTNATCPSCRRSARIDLPKRKYPWTPLANRFFGSTPNATAESANNLAAVRDEEAQTTGDNSSQS